MEATLLGTLPIESRVAVLESKQERAERDFNALAKKIDTLILSAFGAAVLLIVEIVLTANGLLHPHGG